MSKITNATRRDDVGINPVSRLSRVWHRHRVVYESTATVQVKVDIGFPPTLFQNHPHLLIVRNNLNVKPEAVLHGVTDEKLLLLGISSQNEAWWEWSFWCDGPTADKLESFYTELGDECFFTEDDRGEFYRDCLMPSSFRRIALANADKCTQAGEDLEGGVYHELHFDSESSAARFEVQALAFGFLRDSTSPSDNGVHCVFSRLSSVDEFSMHHDVAKLFDLVERFPDKSCYIRWTTEGNIPRDEDKGDRSIY